MLRIMDLIQEDRLIRSLKYKIFVIIFIFIIINDNNNNLFIKNKNNNNHLLNYIYLNNKNCKHESYYSTSKYLYTNDSYSYNLYDTNGDIYIRLFSNENYTNIKQCISDYFDKNYLNIYDYNGNNHYIINLI